MIKAVIFDLDGTILDTLPDLNACMNAALADYGYPLITREQTMAFVGHGGKNFALAALPDDKKNTVDEFYLYINFYFRTKRKPVASSLRRPHIRVIQMSALQTIKPVQDCSSAF